MHRLVIKVFSVIALTLLLNTIALYVSAQNAEPVYRRYTVDDGLPSSMVYHVLQDSKGYIWFATANGVSRFDGYKFENFDLQSGLVDNDVFEIYEDYKNRIWFIPMSGKLCYYENSKIIPYKYNNIIAKYTSSSRGPIKNAFYVDDRDFVYMSIRYYNSFSISPEGVLKISICEYKYCVDAVEIVKHKTMISVPNMPLSKYIKFNGIENDFEISFNEMSDFHHVVPLHLFFIPMPDSSTILTLSQEVVQIKGGKIINKRLYGEEIIWASHDDLKRCLWISPMSGGIQCFEDDCIGNEPGLNLLKNVKVTSVLKDNEGAYWFTTLNDGVFYCPDINVLSYGKIPDLSDNRINAVAVGKSGIYLGYEFAFVDLLKKGKVKHYLSPKAHTFKNTVRSFLIDSVENRVWVSSIVNLNWIENDVVKLIEPSPRLKIVRPKKIIKSKSKGYWIAATTGLVKYYNDKIVYESYLNNGYEGLIYDLAEDYDQTVWFCTINGLWSYQNGVYKFWGDEDSRLGQTSYSLLINPIDTSIWIGTNGAGIIVKKGSNISQITTKEGLISNSISQLFYADKNIWTATRNGLSKVTLSNGGYTIKNFTKANGLPTNEVTSVCEYHDSVYVGTTQGLAVFNKNKVVECDNPPLISISKFKVNDREVDITLSNVALDYDQNSLGIDFVGFVYRNNGRVNYRYRMLGVDSSWVATQTPNCLYNGLSNGIYKFEVEAQSFNGTWSSKPASVIFTINPPFWKRIWFLVLGAILFTTFIFLIYRIRINQIHRRNNLLQNINLYKQQSLRQQMNPHFIFNTLNSIQLYILERDPISSHKYLTKFARLMRMTLDNSLHHTIPLRDEIGALKLYLDLEKLRLEDKFDYSVELVGDDSILNYKIPTLLIQPYVENAIWHGISHKKDQMGWVKISLIDNPSSIACVIEDNGIGRKHAGEISQMKNKEHKSRGSQITQQRIDLLSLMYKEKFSVFYDDLCDYHGTSLGTRVTIKIPKEI